MRLNNRKKNQPSSDLLVKFDYGDLTFAGLENQRDSRYTHQGIKNRCDFNQLLNQVHGALIIVGLIITIIGVLNYQKILPYLAAFSDWGANITPTWEGQLLVFIAYLFGTMINVPNTFLSLVLGYTLFQGRSDSLWLKHLLL